MTVTSTAPAECAGDVAVIVVEFTIVGETAGVPPNESDAPEAKLLPWTVTNEPSVVAPLVSLGDVNSYSDLSVTAGASYLYIVRATNASTSSPDSAPDLATAIIFTNDPLVTGTTTIQAVHLSEMRSAVNGMGAISGQGPFTYATGGSAGTAITAAQINELRTFLDGTLSVIGFATGGYTDALSAGVQIKAVHFQEIRDRVK